MQLKPPTANARVSNQMIPSMLSELAFNKEPRIEPLVSSPLVLNTDKFGVRKNDDDTSSSPFIAFLNGLLCFQSSDRDLFFDAEEKPISSEEDVDDDGRMILASRTSVSTESSMLCSSVESVEIQLDTDKSVRTICELRGGEQQPLYTAQQQQHQQHHQQQLSSKSHNPFLRCPAPAAPIELPVRFLRAGKGDPTEGQRRYEATLQWREEHNINAILFEAHPNYEIIKKHYPHYFHLRGKQGEPVFFEQPPKTDLAALKAAGVTLPALVRHYTMVTEFQWQFLETNDFARSITVLDLEGIRLSDFVGEVVEYVKLCSKFTGQHYPERAGHVIVINVPRWFSMIWTVVKPMVDDVTLQKISIVRGKDAVFAALSDKIPVENIPSEYGGLSMRLGFSPEEDAMRELVAHNNALANGNFSCGGKAADPPCRLCSWVPARSY